MPRTQRQLEATQRARSVQQRNAAQRALDDPRRVANACRIVRAAVDHGVVRIEDVFAEDDRHLVDLARRLAGGIAT